MVDLEWRVLIPKSLLDLSLYCWTVSVLIGTSFTFVSWMFFDVLPPLPKLNIPLWTGGDLRLLSKRAAIFVSCYLALLTSFYSTGCISIS